MFFIVLWSSLLVERCHLARGLLGEPGKQIFGIHVSLSITFVYAPYYGICLWCSKIQILGFWLSLPFYCRVHDHNSGGDIYLAFNAHDYFVDAVIPPPPHHKCWNRVVWILFSIAKFLTYSKVNSYIILAWCGCNF